MAVSQNVRVTPMDVKVKSLPLVGTVLKSELDATVDGMQRNPFAILGPHVVTKDGQSGIAVRIFVPRTQKAWVIEGGSAHPMEQLHREGFFEAFFPGRDSILYHIRLENDRGDIYETNDPYALPTCLTDYD